jgi:hypothetical protein
MTELAYCGLDCQACNFRTKTNCPGCRAAGSKVFWGECALAKCCIAKSLEHCGKCDQFPCEQLKAFSFAKEHGDNGRRIENLRATK